MKILISIIILTIKLLLEASARSVSKINFSQLIIPQLYIRADKECLLPKNFIGGNKATYLLLKCIQI